MNRTDLSEVASFSAPSPVVGEGRGEGTFGTALLFKVKTLSLTLPHDGGRGPE